MSSGKSTTLAKDTMDSRTLGDGRSLSIRMGEEGEEISFHAPDGSLELQVQVTSEGPIVKLSGARLELASTDTVSVKARCFEVKTTETAHVHADGHLTFTSGLDTRMVADGQVHVLGEMIWLN